jgi:hypothetical protein
MLARRRADSEFRVTLARVDRGHLLLVLEQPEQRVGLIRAEQMRDLFAVPVALVHDELIHLDDVVARCCPQFRRSSRACRLHHLLARQRDQPRASAAALQPNSSASSAGRRHCHRQSRAPSDRDHRPPAASRIPRQLRVDGLDAGNLGRQFVIDLLAGRGEDALDVGVFLALEHPVDRLTRVA